MQSMPTLSLANASHIQANQKLVVDPDVLAPRVLVFLAEWKDLNTRVEDKIIAVVK